MKKILWSGFIVLLIVCGVYNVIFDEPAYDRVGKASWYSRNDKGVQGRTASNEPFDDEAMTAAMWGVPFDQKVRVTNRANGRSVVVRINDRGPDERFIRQGRIIDLTRGAFRKIAPGQKGVISVGIQFL